MKHLPAIAGGLLGLAFITFGADHFLHFLPKPGGAPQGSPAANFLGAMAETGYFDFVKAMELIGGLLVAVPKLRNLGLLILGPIIVNILCFNGFFFGQDALLQIPVVAISLLAAYLLIVERRAFSALIHRFVP